VEVEYLVSAPFNLTPDVLPRYYRFQHLFQAQNTLGDIINEIFDDHADRLQVHEDEERDLSLLVPAALGKGIKTFQAITRLCLLGYGEDALVLVRSNINLLINIAYILADTQPTERVKDFLAFSYKERVKYLRLAHGVEIPPWHPPVPPDEVQPRAEALEKVRINQRAQVIPSFHYTQGYRLYSSFEHADAWALSAYIGEWDEMGVIIGSEESDKYIGLALVHSYGILADLLFIFCKFYEIDRRDLFAKIEAMWKQIAKDEAADQIRGTEKGNNS
jgi:Family of unknown function (DUF5677)